VALPEVYATRRGPGCTRTSGAARETVLVRGATSEVSQAAVHVAGGAGATVIATTRSRTGGVAARVGAEAVLSDDGGAGASKVTGSA